MTEPEVFTRDFWLKPWCSRLEFYVFVIIVYPLTFYLMEKILIIIFHPNYAPQSPPAPHP